MPSLTSSFFASMGKPDLTSTCAQTGENLRYKWSLPRRTNSRSPTPAFRLTLFEAVTVGYGTAFTSGPHFVIVRFVPCLLKYFLKVALGWQEFVCSWHWELSEEGRVARWRRADIVLLSLRILYLILWSKRGILLRIVRWRQSRVPYFLVFGQLVVPQPRELVESRAGSLLW